MIESEINVEIEKNGITFTKVAGGGLIQSRRQKELCKSTTCATNAVDVASPEREYVSRRTKNYNDNDSSMDEEEGVDSHKSAYKNTGAIVY